ncbi:hypothetical protein [Streptomyces sp. NPDC003247]|uniref:hypothetical protein n=1 Tax=Streptomyces sp. NPDC003247 TaxID=3364677 RepID=UPI0036B39A1D
MSADEARTTGPASPDRPKGTGRHAAPKKPLLTRFHMPAGKAIAMAAMPTAVLMGMGFTPTLAVADDQPTANSKLADEYQACVTALEGADATASASPSPSASGSDSADDASDAEDSQDSQGSGDSEDATDSTSKGSSADGGSSSSDSGSDDEAEPAPSASSEAASSADGTASSSGATATASPSASATDKNLLETIGDAITDLFDGDTSDEATTGASPSPSASPSASASADSGTSSSEPDAKDSSGEGDSSGGTVEDTTDAVTDEVKDTAEEAAEDTEEAADEATDGATSSPSPSASSTTDAEDCVAATDDEGGVDNKVPVADDPWYLEASSLLLKGADYQGVVEVKTSSGTTKKVLKYVISGGTDIGDLHQLVNDDNSGKTYHVQAGEGTTSTIRDGDTIMYTESISGNLFGLVPITFSPDSPPPLNIPLIYFTDVKVTQAAQFGGTLHIPGMQLYTTD